MEEATVLHRAVAFGFPNGAYFDKKIAEGKTRNEARRFLKRHLANHIWRMMLADEQRLTAVPSGIEIAA